MIPSTIQQVSSCPDYINTFIQSNLEALMNIYSKGYKEVNSGCLYLVCNKTENKMDVQYLQVDMITQMITSESWENLHQSIPEGKKLFFVSDLDLNSIFLIYI